MAIKNGNYILFFLIFYKNSNVHSYRDREIALPFFFLFFYKKNVYLNIYMRVCAARYLMMMSITIKFDDVFICLYQDRKIFLSDMFAQIKRVWTMKSAKCIITYLIRYVCYYILSSAG